MSAMPENSPVMIIGCGNIGKRLAKKLLAQKIDVTGIVSSEASRSECQQKNIPCEILDLDNLQHHVDLTGHRIIYLAPPPRSGKKDTRIEHFLNASKQHPPEKFVLISTTGVYGDCQGAWIDEATPLNPTADRAHRRSDAEQQVQRYCDLHRIPLVILRVAGIYGPGKLPVERIKSGQPIVNEEDSPFTNRIHADDLVAICEKALMNLNIAGIYNVTDGHPGTMYEYFNAVAAALDLPAPPAIPLEQAKHQLSEGMLSYMAESRRISNDRLLNDFEIELSYPTLKQGLQQCVEENKTG
jgi:nucleoside-diphosphate-sugar epimerase